VPLLKPVLISRKVLSFLNLLGRPPVPAIITARARRLKALKQLCPSQTRTGLHALNHEEYAYLLGFQETVTNKPTEQLQQFVEIGAILTISEEDAEKVNA